ncbi:MAG: terminase large subunit [Phycisphaerales bacterium]|nr:terminase large subunit [Phycisphaerales bacterium]
MTARPPINNPSDEQAVAEGCYYDRQQARSTVRWIEETFAFHFYRWQRQLLLLYFGWLRADGGYRFNRITCFVPKKNGKTTLIAAFVGYKLFELRNARIFSAAFNAGQAAYLMEELIKMIRNSPRLAHMMKPRGEIRAICSSLRRDITVMRTNSYYRALADNINANDGLTPDLLVIDEIHRMRNKQVSVLTQSTTKNKNATTVIISTAGSGDKTERCWEEYRYAKDVKDGVTIDIHILPIIHEHPAPASLEGEAIYEMEALLVANPVLRESKDAREAMENELKKARATRHDREWRRYQLGQWCVDADDPYIAAGAYDACTVEPITDATLAGVDCYAGFDCSGGQWDLYALSLLFALEGGRVYEKHYAFASADRIDEMSEKQDRNLQPYIDAGELITIPADAVTDDWLYDWITKELSKWKIKKFAADTYHAKGILERLKADGHDVVSIPQSNNRMMTPHIDDYLGRIRQRRLIHAQNNLYSWQLSCANCHNTRKDLRKIVKVGSTANGRQGGKGLIDNVDAVLNALVVLKAAEIEKAAHGKSTGIYIG